jgi:hypothetical protein
MGIRLRYTREQASLTLQGFAMVLKQIESNKKKDQQLGLRTPDHDRAIEVLRGSGSMFGMIEQLNAQLANEDKWDRLGEAELEANVRLFLEDLRAERDAQASRNGKPVGDPAQRSLDDALAEEAAATRARERHAQTVALGILLAFVGAEVTVPLEIIDSWADEARAEATAYAAARMRAAEDESVEVPPMPAVLRAWCDRMAAPDAPQDPREIVRALFGQQPEALPDPASPGRVVELLAGLGRELPLEVAEGWSPQDRLAVAMWATASQLVQVGTDLQVPETPQVVALYFAPGPEGDDATEGGPIDVDPAAATEDDAARETPSGAPAAVDDAPPADVPQADDPAADGGSEAAPRPKAFNAVGSGKGRGRSYCIWMVTGPLAGSTVLEDLSGTGVAAEAKRIEDALNRAYLEAFDPDAVDWRATAAQLAGRETPEAPASAAQPGAAPADCAPATDAEPDVDLTHRGTLRFYIVPVDGEPAPRSIVDRESQAFVEGYERVPEGQAVGIVRVLAGLDPDTDGLRAWFGIADVPAAATPAELEAPGFDLVANELALRPAQSRRESTGIARLLTEFCRRAPAAWVPLVRSISADTEVDAATLTTARALAGARVTIPNVGETWEGEPDAFGQPILHMSLTGMQLGVTLGGVNLRRWLRELFKIREVASGDTEAGETGEASDSPDADL